MENEEINFQRVRSKKEHDTLTIPVQLLLDKNLTGNSVRLLQIMILYGERPRWTLRQAHLMQESCLGLEAYTNAIQKLIKAGYVRRIRPFTPGKYSAYIYQYCAFPDFKDEKSGEDSNNVCDDVPVRESLYLRLVIINVLLKKQQLQSRLRRVVVLLKKIRKNISS